VEAKAPREGEGNMEKEQAKAQESTYSISEVFEKTFENLGSER
jgi:hypothetical protein